MNISMFAPKPRLVLTRLDFVFAELGCGNNGSLDLDNAWTAGSIKP